MKQTLIFKNGPVITGSFSVSGPKEAKGSISNYIRLKLSDDTFGEKSFEKAESKILYTAIDGALKDSKVGINNLNAVISGDLLNQIISSTFSARNFDCSFLGVYNACASFTEALTIGSTLIDGGYFNNVVCGTSSLFSSAERQYRYPLELGSTRPPLSQCTVTGAGACVLSKKGQGPKITSATVGRVVDFGVTDVNNMGAAMAPAACDTVITHFKELNISPEHYNLIITGDLGTFGSRLFKDLMWEKGYNVENQHVDCGELVYNINEKEYQGGSGAGCSSLVFCSYLMQKLKAKQIKNMLLIATGALLSSVSSQQGESIPCIAHAVSIKSE